MRDFALAENRVDVWRIRLAVPEESIRHCRWLLSGDELQRADRFYFEKHRRRFTAARAAMRQILSRYTGLAAQELVFSYGPKGKPALSGGLEKTGISFNLSHSDEHALLAVTRGFAVGVDIEFVNSDFATEEVAESFFSDNEVRRLQALPRDERVDAFFSCWTRKEAYIKALGEGLSVPLNSFDVAFGAGIPAALLEVRGDPAEVARWSMYDIDVTEGYRAALAVEGRGHQLHHSQWESATLF